MKCTNTTDRFCKPYDLKAKAMISLGAGGMSALFGSGMLYVNPSWIVATSLLAIAISVAMICFFVPWCPKRVAPNAE